jgi:uncharacterized protein
LNGRLGSTVRIDLASIAGTPGAHDRYAISQEPPPTEGYEAVGPVVGEIEVANTGSLLLMRGELRAVVRVRCVRCLVSCECPLVMKIEEQFATAETPRDVLTIDREEPEASAIEDFVLDVSELVRQQLAVNLPMAQLCREDCQGICPQCGQNLNLGPCTCVARAADERWTALGELLGKGQGGAQ